MKSAVGRVQICAERFVQSCEGGLTRPASFAALRRAADLIAARIPPGQGKGQRPHATGTRITINRRIRVSVLGLVEKGLLGLVEKGLLGLVEGPTIC